MISALRSISPANSVSSPPVLIAAVTSSVSVLINTAVALVIGEAPSVVNSPPIIKWPLNPVKFVRIRPPAPIAKSPPTPLGIVNALAPVTVGAKVILAGATLRVVLPAIESVVEPPIFNVPAVTSSVNVNVLAVSVRVFAPAAIVEPKVSTSPPVLTVRLAPAVTAPFNCNAIPPVAISAFSVVAPVTTSVSSTPRPISPFDKLLSIVIPPFALNVTV